jgi:hypothetical protein
MCQHRDNINKTQMAIAIPSWDTSRSKLLKTGLVERRPDQTVTSSISYLLLQQLMAHVHPNPLLTTSCMAMPAGSCHLRQPCHTIPTGLLKSLHAAMKLCHCTAVTSAIMRPPYKRIHSKCPHQHNTLAITSSQQHDKGTHQERKQWI